MMRALAQFIMRGRWQAATVALLGSWFPVVTPATVGLVTLRRGALDGCLVLLWAILPAMAGLWAADVGALMTYLTVAVMLVVLISAYYLRISASWPQTLTLLVAISALASLTLGWLIGDVTALLKGVLGNLATPAEPDGVEIPGIPAERVETAAIGVMAYLVGLSSLIGLIVGRWWQALLYNPGGLQAEIHNLRLPVVVALVSAGATTWCLLRGQGYQSWANVFALPLILAGIGLVHYLVRAYRLGLVTLVVFYAALVMVQPVLLVVAALAFADVFMNIRSRLKSTQ